MATFDEVLRSRLYPTEPRCLRPSEYADERRISRRTVYRLIRTGAIPAERVGGQWRIRVGPHRTTSPAK